MLFKLSKIKHAIVYGLVLLMAQCFFLPNVVQAHSLPPFVSYYWGPISSQGNEHTDKTWNVMYVYRNASPFGWSWTYVNEGHFPDNFRDGISLQAMAHVEPLNPNWSFAVAAGPYLYFDTIFDKSTPNYKDQHGVGLKLDLMTTYDFSPLIFMLGIYHIITIHSYNATALVFGIGFELEPGHPICLSEERNNEISISTGRSLVNAGAGETQRAQPLDIDYRRHFPHHIDWTVSALREGPTTLTNRQGIATEIWARANFFSDRLSLSMGLGPYVAQEREPSNDQRTVFNGLFSASASYVFYKPWGLLGRVTWHRVFTDYNRDSDIFLLGLGVDF